MDQKSEELRKSPRKTRQQTRNNPNSKLFNAAWPKPPTNPTKKSHIKSKLKSIVIHDKFFKFFDSTNFF